MSPLTWGVAGRVSEDENVQLTLTFSESDLAEIVKEMKTDTASEPDRFLVFFFQTLLASGKSTSGHAYP
jgi:hypothetical protein